MKLSVIVCTYNGESKLESCLAALERQSIRDQLQLIVVDDGSSDASVSIARRFSDVELVELTTNVGLSAARNAGLALATSEIVAFTDDDCRPSTQWATLLVNTWSAAPPHVQALGGTVEAASRDTFNRQFLNHRMPLAPTRSGTGADATFVKRLVNYLKRRNQVTRQEGPQYVTSLVGANMSFRRSALSEIGGFDPRRKFGGDEDYVCAQLRQRYGDSAIFCEPSIVMAHEFERELSDTFRRAFAYGRGLGRNFMLEGGIPTVQPLPVLLAATFVAGFWSWWIPLGAAVILPVVLNFDCWRAAWRERRLSMVVYPWIVLLQECASNSGWIAGCLGNLRARRN